jgi:hypothetical protein
MLRDLKARRYKVRSDNRKLRNDINNLYSSPIIASSKINMIQMSGIYITHSETRRVNTILLENLMERGYLGNQDRDQIVR